MKRPILLLSILVGIAQLLPAQSPLSSVGQGSGTARNYRISGIDPPLSKPKKAVNYYWNIDKMVAHDTTYYTYDSVGNCTEYLNQSQKMIYEYDGEGRKTSYLEQDLVNNSWVNYQKFTYIYNQYGDSYQSTEYLYPNGKPQLSYADTSIFLYDNNGNILSAVSGSLALPHRTDSASYTYENGSMVQIVYYSWSASQWIPYLRYDQLRFKAGVPQSARATNYKNTTFEHYTTQRYDHGTWIDSLDVTTTYTDVFGSYADTTISARTGNYLYGSMTTFDSKGNLLRLEGNQFVGGKWATSYPQVYEYYYLGETLVAQTSLAFGLPYTTADSTVYMDFQQFQIAGSNASVSTGELLLYPQPCVAELHIQLTLGAGTDQATYSLKNFLGQEILHGSLKENSAVDVSGLANGIYMLDVKTLDGTYARKVMIE